MNASLAPVRQAASKPQPLDRRVIKPRRLLEKVVEGLGTEIFFELLQNPAPALRFAREQIKNSWSATRKKAEQFLKGVQKRAKTPPA
jgi:hypothetical protein